MEREYFDWDDDGDAEVDALWNGQLPMDRVLQTLKKENEGHIAAIARAEAAERELAEAEARAADYLAVNAQCVERADEAERELAELKAVLAKLNSGGQIMGKHISWTGANPSLETLADVIQQRDAALSRAEAAENERDALRALSIRVEFGGTIYNFDKALAAIPGGASIDSITVKIDDMKLVAAEQRVAELEAQRDDYHMKWVDVGFELGQFADDLIAVLKLQLTDNDDEATTLATIVTRVTELEAQLAVQAWRPVTEPPIEEGEYWGWDAHDGVFITHYNPDRDYDDDWAWSDWSGEMIPVDMWSPLIPPPPPSNSTGLAP
jgi:DNA repair exonuclease SbcCD ATPase subunit